MDMDLAVKLNLAGVAMSRRRKLEATNLLNKQKERQARHVERTNYDDERSNEKITSRANEIICPFY
jgi:hypothetical protein